MKRREFFTGLAAILLPPLPPGFKPKHKRIESPKGREHRMSFSVMQKPAASKAFAVTPAGFSINSIQYASGTVILQWSGGTGPYQVQRETLINGPWVNIGNPTIATSKSVPSPAPTGFFRVQQQVPLLTMTQDESGQHFSWGSPDLG